MRRLKNALVGLALVAITFPMAACGKQTTLDKVGAIAVTGASLYQQELDNLLARNVISAAKHAELSAQAAEIKRQAAALGTLISGFGNIDAKNKAAVVAQIGAVLALVTDSLHAAQLGGLPPDSKIFTALNYIDLALVSAESVLAVLFPAPPAGEIASSRAVPSTSPAIPARKINVPLPARPKGF